jgi:nitrogen fixation protein NifZ
MIEPRLPIYQWGERVRAVGDLVNDGSYPGLDVDAVIVPSGEIGEIVQIGAHTDSNTPVYLVEFPERRVVGCFEEEISRVGAD